jgi:hypothetical protein
MADTEVPTQLRSFISFALASKPTVTIHRHCDDEALPGESVQFTFEQSRSLSSAEVSSLEAMMKKYEPLRELLQAAESPAHAKGFEIETCSPVVEFQPGVSYHIVNVDKAQVDTAREMARRVERTYKLHHAGDHSGARTAYNELHQYLQRQRTALVGGFKDVPTITKAVGMHGVANNRALARARADSDCGGLVIFVIIEIFIG